MVISPFISFKELDLMFQDGTDNVSIVTSWRSDYLITGYSDPDLYRYCKGRGWKLYVNNRLHAKIFVFDHETAIVGSSNFTHKGLGDDSSSNLESNLFINLNPGDLKNIMKIIDCSLEVDDSVYDRYSRWVEAHDELKMPTFGSTLTLDTSVPDVLPSSGSIREMWGAMQIDSASTSEDMDKYEVSQKPRSLDELSECMRNLFDEMEFVIEFREFVDSEDYGRRFGECRRWVRNRCPEYNRDEVDDVVNKLYSWLSELFEEYIVIRPNYSEVIINTKYLPE